MNERTNVLDPVRCVQCNVSSASAVINERLIRISPPAMNLMGVLKLTGSSYLPGLSAGPHSCDADCGADGTAAAGAVEAVARGGSDLGWQNLRLGWVSEM